MVEVIWACSLNHPIRTVTNIDIEPKCNRITDLKYIEHLCSVIINC